MKVIVTGGFGFIGSHLTERLVNEGHEVTVIDNFSTGRPDNLKHLEHDGNLKPVIADICDHEAISRYFEGVEVVYHLAALADIVPSIQHPEKYFRANVDGTFSVLRASLTAGVKKFIYTASSSCYGIPDLFPTPETAVINPQYPYALTKYIGEELTMHWAKVYKFPAVSLRLFNVYGPRSRTSGTYGAVFGVFLAQKLAGKPFTIVGDGHQTRDFTFVTDVADAFVTAAGSGVTGEIFNVGSGGTYSINRLVELLGGEKIHIPKRPGEPECTFADNSKIREMLKWRPRVSFEDGVKKILDNIDYWKEAPLWTPDSIKEATADWFKYLSASK